MTKLVLVLSCTVDDDILILEDPVTTLLDKVKPFFEDNPDVHIWAGIQESADAVLNVIGLD